MDIRVKAVAWLIVTGCVLTAMLLLAGLTLQGAAAQAASLIGDGDGDGIVGAHFGNGSMQAPVAPVQERRVRMEAAGNSSASISTRLEALQWAVACASWEIFFGALMLIPLAALMIHMYLVFVRRPLRKLYRIIAALGHGRYTHPVHIEFPGEMRRLGKQLDWMRRRLARLEADKDRFLRQVTHELKTPLATLKEGSGLLCEGALGELNDGQREVAVILAESTIELESLIANLLAYAQWRARRAHAEHGWFDTRPLIDALVSPHMLWMGKRRLKMELNIARTRLFGQRSQLRMALDNLLTNAIKHAPAGSTIEISVAAADGAFELAVRDHGRGVRDEEKTRIFEPFVRGNETEEQGVRGTGVGLSIVKEIAHAHGGCVEVKDAHPGAYFYLRWPCPHPQHFEAAGMRREGGRAMEFVHAAS